MDNKPPIKVIIDTNLWISFLIGKQLAKTLVPIFSPQLLNEINLVTKRPKLQKHATSQKPLRGKMKATTASLASQPIACGC
ncbi:putative toxin-antitoxin system toxin component, PIN family [Microcystis aeruginosa FBCC-A68]|uniref:putative toxin-antitoxin system toxin component, PIN family n=1 Tax=Microcystis aeruginosa TaxID=1126 RepID=UPI0020164EF8|nr:putative toxin-antitoxin system toxin component, PIN family [Microcystis aeruginosa]